MRNYITTQSTYIGRRITINVLRSFILDQGLSDADTVLLHEQDFDTLALEYRTTYRQALPEPYFLLGVLIEPAPANAVPLNRVAALRDDDRPHRLTIAVHHGPLTDDYRPIYRCGYCGTFTSAVGEPLTGDELVLHQRLLQLRGSGSRVQHLTGHCCRHLD